MTETDVLARVRITRHARATMTRRGVHLSDAVAAIAKPDVVEECRDGITRYTRGRLCVVTARTDDPHAAIVLITVLLRERDDWDDEQCRRGWRKGVAA